MWAVAAGKCSSRLRVLWGLTSPYFRQYASCNWWRFWYLVVPLPLGCLLAWTLVLLAICFIFSSILGCFLFMEFCSLSSFKSGRYLMPPLTKWKNQQHWSQFSTFNPQCWNFESIDMLHNIKGWEKKVMHIRVLTLCSWQNTQLFYVF